MGRFLLLHALQPQVPIAHHPLCAWCVGLQMPNRPYSPGMANVAFTPSVSQSTDDCTLSLEGAISIYSGRGNVDCNVDISVPKNDLQMPLVPPCPLHALMARAPEYVHLVSANLPKRSSFWSNPEPRHAMIVCRLLCTYQSVMAKYEVTGPLRREAV